MSGQVWLIGGASGTGKTHVAYPVARALGAPIVEVDDIVEALLCMTTPEQQPVLHFRRTHPEAARYAPEQIVDLQVAVAEALVPALDAVVGNHLETRVPVVIEGDYLLPSFAVRSSYAGQSAEGRVRAVFVDEPDERRLVRNYRDREPAAGEQVTRARVSWLYGAWLAVRRMAGARGRPLGRAGGAGTAVGDNHRQDPGCAPRRVGCPGSIPPAWPPRGRGERRGGTQACSFRWWTRRM